MRAIGKSVEIDAQMRMAAREYAERSVACHFRGGRDAQTAYDNVYTGRLGELAYCKACGMSYDMLGSAGDCPDKGYDVVDDGVMVDVKTIPTPFKRVFFNMSYVRCDAYAVIALNSPLGTASLVAIMDKTHALSIAKRDRNRWFFEVNYQ